MRRLPVPRQRKWNAAWSAPTIIIIVYNCTAHIKYWYFLSEIIHITMRFCFCVLFLFFHINCFYDPYIYLRIFANSTNTIANRPITTKHAKRVSSLGYLGLWENTNMAIVISELFFCLFLFLFLFLFCFALLCFVLFCCFNEVWLFVLFVCLFLL